ncbi:MAG: alpha-amylase family glycosyl hydrolase [Gammaproteobacteria bacterium]
MFQNVRRALPLMALAALHALAPQTAAAAAARVYSEETARDSPAWVHDGIVYEIFPRNFSAQGNLAGVTAQLDRLQQLGVNILWLMPIHPTGKLKSKGTFGSPYAVRDYYAINPEYGTAADLHRLVGEAHRRNFKVIIDVVANHTAWDSVLMQHPEFYEHDAGGRIVPPQPDWADVAHLQYTKAGVPNLALRAYMRDMLVHWIKDFDLDGFRCDAAARVPADFWEDARAALAKVKPDILMLAESDSPELLLKAFDVDYAWSLYEQLAEAIQGRQPASVVRDAWSTANAAYPHGALRLRFADNHDERRALARFGEPAVLAASALMLTLDGVPLIYNGMEVGDTAESAAPALFEKLPVFWPSAELRPQFPVFFQQLIALRKAHPALRSGEVQWLHNNDESRVLTFARRGSGENLLVAINLSSVPFAGLVAVADGQYEDITPAPAASHAAVDRALPLPALSLGAWQYKVLRTRE